jgi:glycosyltransferase involved in cell wall biosynthesis
MENPLTSVLMTAYNRKQYIAEAIESVLASTYKNFELIIVDDCSGDNTVLIAKEYEKRDARIKLYINEQNLGDYRNRNKAASYARGEYLMYVDSDDKIFADGIEKCIRVMLQYPQSCFGMRIFNQDCEPYEINSEAVIRKHFFEDPMLYIGPGGTIIKRIFFEQINKYPVKYGPANDKYFNLKAACNSSMVMIPFDFLFYRRHEGQEINNQYSYLYNNYIFLKDALNELPFRLTDEKIRWLHSKNKRRFFVNIIKYFFSTLNFPKTIAALKQTRFSFKDMFEAIFH